MLGAALDVFVEMGYHGASVRDIARRAGLSVPGIYHHYATKQEMLTTILDLRMEDLLWRSRAAQDEGGGDPVRRFELLIECLVLYHTYRRDLAFMGASEMRNLDPGNRRRLVRAAGGAATDGRRSGRRGRRQRPLHDAVPTTARAVVTMCTTLPQWYRSDGPLMPEQIAERYVHLALATVQARRRHRAR